MRFLLDVNASATIARWLQTKGHDVILVSSRNEKMKDHEILEWARHENRIIITTDDDFEEMIWRQRKPHHGVLRLENVPRQERIVLVEDSLKLHSGDLEAGAIVIALRKKFRVRHP